jgi:hypothetical protein
MARVKVSGGTPGAAGCSSLERYPLASVAPHSVAPDGRHSLGPSNLPALHEPNDRKAAGSHEPAPRFYLWRENPRSVLPGPAKSIVAEGLRTGLPPRGYHEYGMLGPWPSTGSPTTSRNKFCENVPTSRKSGVFGRLNNRFVRAAGRESIPFLGRDCRTRGTLPAGDHVGRQADDP